MHITKKKKFVPVFYKCDYIDLEIERLVNDYPDDSAAIKHLFKQNGFHINEAIYANTEKLCNNIKKDPVTLLPNILTLLAVISIPPLLAFFFSVLVNNQLPETSPIIATSTPPAVVTVTGVAASRHEFAWDIIEQDFAGATMIMVPAGCFDMGDEEYNRPRHPQCIRNDFWIDKVPVTQQQFVIFGGTSQNAVLSQFSNLPVTGITWEEARDYCQQKRGARLPTEAEWEYVARGTNSMIFPWGNEFDASKVVWNLGKNEGPLPVGSLPGNKSWVGALDMAGGVWEWVSSGYASYPYQEQIAEDLNIQARILRGGSWHNNNQKLLQSSMRGWANKTESDSEWGFRCAKSFAIGDSRFLTPSPTAEVTREATAEVTDTP